MAVCYVHLCDTDTAVILPQQSNLTWSYSERMGRFNRNQMVTGQGKIVTNKVFLVRHSNIWSKSVVVTCYIAGVDVE